VVESLAPGGKTIDSAHVPFTQAIANLAGLRRIFRCALGEPIEPFLSLFNST